MWWNVFMVRSVWQMLGGIIVKDFAVKLSTPTSVDIAITRKCNHRCIHCYNVWRMDESNTDLVKVLTDDQINTIADELVKNNVWRATITGGEPLAELSVLYKIIQVFNSKHISLGMNTNLSLMTDDIANLLTSKYSWKNILLTSLPGLTAEICDKVTQVNGSYKKITDGIDICAKHNIPVGINIVISKKNIDQLENLYPFLEKHSVSYVSITRAIAPLYDRDNPLFYLSEAEIIHIADILEKVHRTYGIKVGSVTPFPLCILKDISKYQNIVSASCAAGISRCSIDAVTGNISACTHEDKVYGNIYSTGLKKAWDNMYEWREGLIVNDECKGCQYLSFCGGECRMIAGTESHIKYNLDRNAAINYVPYSPIEPITKETIFKVSKNVRYRREDFGGVLRCEVNECYVSENIILIFEYIKERETVTLDDFLEMCEENKYLYDAIAELEKMNILRRI